MARAGDGPPAEGPEVAAYRAAGLWDPDAPRAGERLELLDWLVHERGFTVGELATARTEGRTGSLAGDRVLRSEPRWTVADVAARLGLAPAAIEATWRAAGFAPGDPSARRFTDAEADALAVIRATPDVFSETEAMHFIRVVGASLSRIADAAVSLFLQDVEAPLVAAGGSELVLAQKNLRAIELLLGLTPLIDVLFRAHVEEAIRRSRVARAQCADYHAAAMAIGFVDLVGFTPLADQLSPAELGRLVADFEARAFDAVAEHGGRVVKLIGDEVMFVALDAEAACRAALALIAGFRDGGRATPRGGVAFGDLVIRGGDYYGPVVNLAARMAELAVPSELPVTPAVARRAPGLAFAPAGRRMPKGFTTPVELLSAEA